MFWRKLALPSWRAALAYLLTVAPVALLGLALASLVLSLSGALYHETLDLLDANGIPFDPPDSLQDRADYEYEAMRDREMDRAWDELNGRTQ